MNDFLLRTPVYGALVASILIHFTLMHKRIPLPESLESLVKKEQINLDRVNVTTMDPVVSCPYDETHIVRKNRLPYHLTRCKLNNNSSTNNSKVCCPFNACHIVEEEHLESHVGECQSGGNVKNFSYDLEPRRLVGIVPLEEVAKLKGMIMEDWIEENVETYDPWKSTFTRNIIRCKVGGTKTQKKKFKLAERERIRLLEKAEKFRLQQTVSFKYDPLKHNKNVSRMVRNLNAMTLEDVDDLMENMDISKLHISEVNKFHKYKYISQLVEDALTRKLNELMLHCIKEGDE